MEEIVEMLVLLWQKINNDSAVNALLNNIENLQKIEKLTGTDQEKRINRCMENWENRLKIDKQLDKKFIEVMEKFYKEKV